MTEQSVPLPETLTLDVSSRALKTVGGVVPIHDVIAYGDARAAAERARLGLIVVDRAALADAIIYHYGQNGRGQCRAGCDVRLGSSLAEHAIDVALAGTGSGA